AVRGADAVDADLAGEKRDPGSVFTETGDQVDVDERHLAPSLHRPHERAEMERRRAKKEDDRHLRGQRSRQLLGTTDDGRDRNARKGVQEAGHRSIDGADSGGRHDYPSAHRHLLFVAVLNSTATLLASIEL